MPKKLKIKADAIVKGDIPDDTEELELDCKEIGKDALANHILLKSVTLINTEVIGENAFRGCRMLEKIELPETLREIGDRAFEYTLIKPLVIPPSVTKLGSEILSLSLISRGLPVLEIYLKNGKTAPFFDGSLHLAYNTKLIVRSLETNEILFQFVVFSDLEEVLTEHGADFTEYDNRLNVRHSGNYKISDTELEAACLRVHYPVGMSEEKLEKLKADFSNAAGNRLKKFIGEFFLTTELYDISKFPYYDDISGRTILELTSFSIKKGIPDVTETLMKVLYNKCDDIGSIIDISDSKLMEVIDQSVRLGMTELTALLMQRLHERRSGNNNE